MNPLARRQFILKILGAIGIACVGLWYLPVSRRFLLNEDGWWFLLYGICGLCDLSLSIYWFESAHKIICVSRSGTTVGLTINRSKDGRLFYLCKVSDLSSYHKSGSSYSGGVLAQSESYAGISRCLRTWTERIRGWGYNVRIV